MPRNDIQAAIEQGERNRDAQKLLANWCAHARIERDSGVGLIEAQTGLPIGLQSVACPHAPPAGLMFPEVREAIIDFYDRNCATCTVRKPVRLPNIVEFIGERDRAHEAERRREEMGAAEARAALGRRQAERERLYTELNAVSRTILEDLDAYDQDRTPENLARLIGAARVAPERFAPRLKNYVLSLARRENWFAEAGARLFHLLGGDPAAVVDLALGALVHRATQPELIDTILALADHANEAAVQKALPILIDLASPHREFGPYPSADDRPLLAFWPRHQRSILAAADTMLSSRRRFQVEATGRMLSTLQKHDPDAADPLARSLASTFARANLLIDDLEDEDDGLSHLSDALRGVFESIPDQLDAILQSLSAGSDRQSATRVLRIYARAFKSHLDEGPIPPDSRRHRLALSRLIWAATVPQTEVGLRTIHSALQHWPDHLLPVARAEIEGLFGASLLVSDLEAKLRAELMPPNAGPLEGLTREARAGLYRGIASSLLSWSVKAAAGDAAAADRVMALVNSIPEDNEPLRAYALKAVIQLAEDVDGLRRVLPLLYQGLVGASAWARAAGARAIGEFRWRTRQNLPPLVFEAFLALLGDPIVGVHKAAVQALQRSSMPEVYQERIGLSLLLLIRVYRIESHQDKFLADCIQIAAGLTGMFGENAGSIRRYLIEVAAETDPSFIRPELPSLSFRLGVEPSCAGLLARMLPSMVDPFNRDDVIGTLLQRLPPDGVRAHWSELRDAAIDVVRADLWTAFLILETIARNTDGDEAPTTVKALIDAFEDTVSTRLPRLALRKLQLLIAYEPVVAAADPGRRQAVRQALDDVRQAMEAAQEDQRERNRRSGLFVPL